MFWEKFVDLCNEKNTTPTAVVNSLGIAVGSVTKWRNGSAPRYTTLAKIADYFGVTVDELLKGPETVQKEKPADEGELGENVVIYNRNGKNVKKKFTKEQMSVIRAMLDATPSDEGEEDI